MSQTPVPSQFGPGTRLEHLSPVADARRSTVQAQPHKLGWPRKLAFSIIATDAAVIALAILVGHIVRFGVDSTSLEFSGGQIAYAAIGPLIGVVWMVALAAGRTREHRIIGVGLTEFTRVMNMTFITFGVLAIVSYLAKLELGRGYLLIALPTGLTLLLLDRLAWRRVLQWMRRGGRCLTGAIIVGPRRDVAKVVAQLRRNLRAGYRPIAVTITDGDTQGDDGLDELPRVPMKHLVTVSKRTRTRAVMIAGELPRGQNQIRDLGWDLENSKVGLILLSRLTDVSGPRIHLRPIEGLPMVDVDLPQYTGFNHTVKRVIDVVLSAAALIVLAPVVLAISVAVRWDGTGPALFRQERIGAHGSRFNMLKFRSMVVDAEARLPALVDKNEGNGVLFKLRDDPRVTSVGRFLRKTSLDELPQLWNVLKGDMSLVGPRPPLQSEVERYEHRVNRRLLIKPGITGLWQISGRSNMSWDEAVKLDLYYVENWSITSDLLILLRTVKAVVTRKGAY
jgi:exopolysaccharide biosynthesis polyprenyl glycosylphosphotransferase